MSGPSLTKWEQAPDPRGLYLDALKRFLTRYGFEEHYRPMDQPRGGVSGAVYQALRRGLASKQLELVHSVGNVDLTSRSTGHDLPGSGETMIGLRRLDNLQSCIVEVLDEGIPGDLIETGVWRGGQRYLCGPC